MAISKTESIKASAFWMQLKFKRYMNSAKPRNLERAKKHIAALQLEAKSLKEYLLDSIPINIASNLIDSVNNLIPFEEIARKLEIDSGSMAVARYLADYHIEQKISNIVVLCEKIQFIQEQLNNNKLVANENFARKVGLMDLLGTLFTLFILLIFGWVLIKDINTRNQLERELRQAKLKAENTSEIKELFMANMSHEIRTPMTAIIGFTNLLGRTNLNMEQEDYVRTIKSSSENLLTIVNDILDFSKIEAGMVRIEEVPFNPQDLLHSINTMFLPKIEEKNIKLTFIKTDPIPDILLGDSARLTQILINLVGNAVKFTNRGAIIVAIRLVAEDVKTAILEFKISDTGIGIPQNKLKVIFDRFQQAELGTNRQYGGTGLGLSIVKRLVELQGGSIQVESEEGRGSTFTFTIPFKKKLVKDESTPVIIEKAIEKQTKKNINILVAEDNPLNRKLIKALFKEWGLTVEFAENGELAIEKVKSGKFGLVLMDIQMPKVNGYEATKYIREQLNSSIPIIAMTAHALAGEKEKCIGFGMTDYISKPIHEIELHSLIVKYSENIEVNERTKFYYQEKSENKVTNLDFLTNLANGKKDFFDEMITIFLEECPKEIDALKKSIEDQDISQIHACAHAMKSTIPFVGLDIKLKQPLEDIENSSNIQQINELFLFIEATCILAMQELKKP
ncbi:MAG: ATP-binding protein [Bacteroidia bacterium]